MNVIQGTTVQTTASFSDPDGVATDPTTVVLKVKSGATVTAYTYGTGTVVTRVSTGVYQASIATTPSTSLTWYVEWIGTGACSAVQVASFAVQPRPF